MKKNVLALSIAAMIGGLGVTGAANAALAVNESGSGHILTIPYYTAQNGNMTVFHLTNTDDKNGKAVKVRFRGASNSDDVLDFQVFMSPGDVWTAAVTKGADGKAQLVTADKTCTLPVDLNEGKTVPFITDRLTKKGWTAEDKAAQTREGYIEILNMADIVGTESYAADKTPLNFFSAIKHKNGVAPCTSSFIQDTLNWEQVVKTADVAGPPIVPGVQWRVAKKGADVTKVGTDAVAATADGWKDVGLRAPTGTLNAQWYIMNVEQTTTFSGAANAIKASAGTWAVFSPQKNGDAVLVSADPLLAKFADDSSVIKPQYYDVPDLSTPYEGVNTAINAKVQAENLTNAIKVLSVSNQYATAVGVNAKTDWVFSMPTRRYSVAANYGTTAKVEDYATADAKQTTAAGTSKSVVAPAYRVFSEVTGNAFSFANEAKVVVNDAGQLCLEAEKATFWDREEQSKADGAVFSPGTPETFKLCGEVSVTSFSNDASAVGASLTRQVVKAPYTNGWGNVVFTNDATKAVPMLGAAFIKLSNPQAAAGVSGTYGITWPHSYAK